MKLFSRKRICDKTYGIRIDDLIFTDNNSCHLDNKKNSNSLSSLMVSNDYDDNSELASYILKKIYNGPLLIAFLQKRLTLLFGKNAPFLEEVAFDQGEKILWLRVFGFQACSSGAKKNGFFAMTRILLESVCASITHLPIDFRSTHVIPIRFTVLKISSPQRAISFPK